MQVSKFCSSMLSTTKVLNSLLYGALHHNTQHETRADVVSLFSVMNVFTPPPDLNPPLTLSLSLSVQWTEAALEQSVEEYIWTQLHRTGENYTVRGFVIYTDRLAGKLFFSRCLFKGVARIYAHTASKAVIFKRLYEKYEKGGKFVTGKSDICLASFWGRPSDRNKDNMKLILEKQRAEVRNELTFITLRKLAQAVPLQACIQEVPGLNLCRSGHLRHIFSKFSSLPPDNSSYCITF